MLLAMGAAILFCNACRVSQFYIYLCNTEINGKCRMASLCRRRETADSHNEHKRSRVHMVGKQWWHMYRSEFSWKVRFLTSAWATTRQKTVKMKKTLQVAYLYAQSLLQMRHICFFCTVDGAVAVKICAMA